MSYPAPPGLKNAQTTTSSTTQPHHSLPARPVTSAVATSSNFKSTHASPSTSAAGAPGTGSYGAFTGFRPRAVAASKNDWRSASPTVSAGPQPPSAYTASQANYSAGVSQPAYQYSQQGQYQQNQYQQHPVDQYSTETPPQIRNPFPLPGQDGYGRGGAGPAYDPEVEAQIAQWQSAYMSKDESTARFGAGASAAGNANTIPLGSRASNTTQLSTQELASAVKGDSGVAAVVSGADGKQKTVVRSGGGQTWQDSSLLEWDPAHFRLFVGNLAGEVTDDSLLKAFSKYESVQKARVVRDKRTTKSKGYGFVSFSNGDQFFQAAKDMQGKYIGSHPVILRRSTTEIKAVNPQDKRHHKHGKGGGKGGGGANTGAGVSKKPSKTKGGLKILG